MKNTETTSYRIMSERATLIQERLPGVAAFLLGIFLWMLMSSFGCGFVHGHNISVKEV